ncbi:MAG: T9SS type A sorting domain-containing protein, partial [Candidatus Kapaibacterium sp.]
VFMARSSDGGESWQAHIPVIVHLGEQTLDSTFEDKYYITIDNTPESPHFGDIYIPWKRVTPRDSATQIVISKSTDRGDSWSEPVPISHRVAGSSEDTTFGQSFPLVACGPDGEVYAVWHHGIEHAIGYAKSTDGGDSWSQPEMIHTYERFGQTIFIPNQGWRHGVKNKVRAECYPVVVADNTDGPRHGNVYVCWAQDNPPNIYFMKSTDGGDSWSQPVIVQSDTTNDQFWPWMSLDPTSGELAIMYLDSRDDPQNILTDCYVSWSSDGGETWIDRRASDIAGDLRNNPFNANSFAGDYSGNAFYDGRVYPSWIDMRRADKDIFDSDVFTAIVDTRAPVPPKNFHVAIIPELPDELRLSWETPSEGAFGQPFDIEDLSYEIYRDGELIASPAGSATEYSDEGLAPHQLYKYKLYAALDGRKSRPAADSAWAGGSEQPAAPVIISAAGSESDNALCEAEIHIPALREDGQTPLVNLSKLNIYIDGEIFDSIDLVQADTGRTMSLVIPVDVKTRGFYKIFAAITDRHPEFGENESDPSGAKIFYTGAIAKQYEDGFNQPPLNKYLISSGWAITQNFFHSAPASITESPDGDYSGSEADTLIIFPVVKNSQEKFELSFWHAAIVKRQDVGYVEYSSDPESDEWTTLAEFDENHYQPWKDDDLTAEDWKIESFEFDPGYDTAYVRFRFTSNIFSNRDGWYVDDIAFGAIPLSAPESESEEEILLYPNPAMNYVTIRTENIAPGGINIYNTLGENVSGKINVFVNSGSELTLDVSQLSPGVYIVEIPDISGHIYKRRIISIAR